MSKLERIKLLETIYPELEEERIYLLALLAEWVDRLSPQEQKHLVTLITDGSYIEEICAGKANPQLMQMLETS